MQTPCSADPLPVPSADEVDITSVPLFVCGISRWGRLGLGKDMTAYRIPKPSRALYNQKVIGAACGAGHSLVIVENDPKDPLQNTVYSWGKCNFGQLGHNEEETDKNAATRITALDHLGVITVGAGDAHSMAVLHNGDVLTWGSGFYGCLGHGNEESKFIPTKIPDLKNITKVSAGKAHTLALNKEGQVFSFGRNDSSQLGLGSTISQKSPKLISTLQDKFIIDIACGDLHCICVDKNGVVYIWGSNLRGQMSLPIDVKKVILPTLLPIENPVAQVGASLHFCWAVDNKNQLWMWGDNLCGQLSAPEEPYLIKPRKVIIDGKPIEVKKVAASQYSTSCISSSGSVFMWGSLFDWQDTVKERVKPTGNMVVPVLFEGLDGRNPIDLACGCNHLVVIVDIIKSDRRPEFKPEEKQDRETPPVAQRQTTRLSGMEGMKVPSFKVLSKPALLHDIQESQKIIDEETERIRLILKELERRALA